MDDAGDLVPVQLRAGLHLQHHGRLGAFLVVREDALLGQAQADVGVGHAGHLAHRLGEFTFQDALALVVLFTLGHHVHAAALGSVGRRHDGVARKAVGGQAGLGRDLQVGRDHHVVLRHGNRVRDVPLLQLDGDILDVIRAEFGGVELHRLVGGADHPEDGAACNQEPNGADDQDPDLRVQSGPQCSELAEAAASARWFAQGASSCGERTAAGSHPRLDTGGHRFDSFLPSAVASRTSAVALASAPTLLVWTRPG